MLEAGSNCPSIDRADRIKAHKPLVLTQFVLNADERSDDCNVETLRVVSEKVYLCFPCLLLERGYDAKVTYYC